jgi:hypothetical protein
VSEFEEQLHAILSDPAELERIGRLASELMGGGEGREEGAGKGTGGGAEGDVLRRLSGLLGGGGQGELTALLDALAPYVRPERLSRLRRALWLAGMLRVAGTVLGEEASGLV